MTLANRFLQPPYIYIWATTIGLILASGVWYYYEYQPSVLSFSYTPAPIAHTSHEQPSAISIPKINLSLAVEPGYVRNNVWTVSEHYVSHLATSGRPGEQNNIVIYGHDKPTIFGNLHALTSGDEIIVSTKDHEYVYEVVDSFVTTPSNVSVLETDGSEQLTIFTCTGPFDSQRLVIQAKPKRA